MSAHTRKHHTREYPCEVILTIPGKGKRHSYIPQKAVKQIESVLSQYQDNDSIDWCIIAKDRIDKYKQAGLVLRGARGRENMSQKELARLSGVSQENISRIENGKRSVGKKVAQKLAKVLKFDYTLLLEDFITESCA